MGVSRQLLCLVRIDSNIGAYGNVTSTVAIDRGIYYILFAIVLGVFTEISWSIAKGEVSVRDGASTDTTS